MAEAMEISATAHATRATRDARRAWSAKWL
jgi:hypothetical protein